MRDTHEHTTVTALLGAAGLALAVSCLQGCSWGFITGESGIEYSLRINPITHTESEQEFDTRTIRFGRSKQASNRGEK